MRLLIITQVMERKDPQLGFFVRWVEELAKRVETVKVICLKKGEYNPIADAENTGATFRRTSAPLDNVPVYSLGKEVGGEGESTFIKRLRYIVKFYKILFQIRGTYDVVFVHMNDEYVLLAGPIWRMLGIPVFHWRNHYQGGWMADFSGFVSSRIFCTSRYSYTAKFKKTKIMPVGVDVDSLNMEIPIERIKKSILFLARFDRSKKPHLLVEALAELHKKGIEFVATFVGGPSEPESTYVEEVKELARTLGISDLCNFVGVVPNTETFRYYRSHEIYVNCAKSGMLDKTIFKAAAAGCLVVASSLDIAEYVPESNFKENSKEDLARVISHLLKAGVAARAQLGAQFDEMVSSNTLTVLADKLVAEMNGATLRGSKLN